MASSKKEKTLFKDEYLKNGIFGEGVKINSKTELILKCHACNTAVFMSLDALRDSFPDCADDVGFILKRSEEIEKRLNRILSEVMPFNIQDSNYKEI